MFNPKDPHLFGWLDYPKLLICRECGLILNPGKVLRISQQECLPIVEIIDEVV